MGDPFKETNWLGNIPVWLKAFLGLFGTIGAIAGFIIAFRENVQLYTTIAVLLVLAYIFLVSLYIFVARRKGRSKKIPSTYRFGKYRFLGASGMLIVCVLLAVASALPLSREFATSAIRGTQTSIPSPTAVPTWTAVPTVTVTPPPQLASPDVWIAKFHIRDDARDVAAEAWIEDALRTQLEQFQGQKISVRTDDQSIERDAQAQDIVNNQGSKVVIWGWYTGKEAEVKMLLSGGQRAGTVVPVTGVIDLLAEREDDREISITIRKKVPQNITFMSLFVLGHIAYLSNNYQAGHEAFDAAMSQLPAADEAVIENQAIMHFFQARSLQKQSEPDLEGAICEYVEAILEDLQGVEQADVVQVADVAYNNLGQAVSQFRRGEDQYSHAENIPLPEGALLCLQGLRQAGLLEEDYEDPRIYFQRALDVNPGLTLAAYNKAIFEWLRDWRKYTDETKVVMQSQMEEFQNQDPTLVGTYIILATIHEEFDEDQKAMQSYLAGIEQNPRIPLMQFNLGQLYLSHAQDEAEAEKHFKAALFLDPNHLNARLALGNLYYRIDRSGEAAEEVDRILPLLEQRFFSPAMETLLLRSGIAFKQGDLAAARAYMNRAIEARPRDPYPHLLLGLLQQYEGLSEEAAVNLDSAGQMYLSPDFKIWSFFHSSCLANNEELLNMSFSEWARDRLPSSSCLGRDLSDPKERVLAFYDLASDELLKLRDLPMFEILGAQCPFLYTEDPLTGEWEFETTILYKIVNREAAQMRRLTQFNGRLLIREEEPEVTYLNQLYVLAEMADGSFQTLAPDVDELQRADAEYIVLHRGDEIVVTLDDYPVTGAVKQWWVMAAGYYTPLR